MGIIFGEVTDDLSKYEFGPNLLGRLAYIGIWLVVIFLQFVAYYYHLVGDELLGQNLMVSIFALVVTSFYYEKTRPRLICKRYKVEKVEYADTMRNVIIKKTLLGKKVICSQVIWYASVKVRFLIANTLGLILFILGVAYNLL